MKIGVLSDTHGEFSPQFREFFQPCDELWHAGDFGGGVDTAREIAEFKPLVGVVGNCDDRALIYDYPLYRFFEREGKSVLITHIGGFPGKYDSAARRLIHSCRPDIFVCGRSHILRVMYDNYYNMLVINPGAAGIQGFHTLRTAVRFDIDNGNVSNLELFKLER